MRVNDLSKVKGENAGIMAFGFFDSIHLGHRSVISEAIRLARESGTVASVFLFRNNIFPILGIEKYPIYTFEERLALIDSLGVDAVYFVDADKEYLSLSPDSFISDLKEKIALSGFTCGSDFSFGAMGRGEVSDLIASIGGKYRVIDLLTIDGEKVSTERVKDALRRGDLSAASSYLGRTFTLRRNVMRGRSDGSKMGFPTVNTEILSAPLRDGVYFTTVSFDGSIYRAVTNVGTHPTFDDMKRNIESYLLDYEGDLYGEEIEISFLRYHRGIEKYDSVDELKDKIDNDVRERRMYD